MEVPFWKRKTLEQMTPEEWESLCDGCARCCLNKLEDIDTGTIYVTSVACRYLDLDTGRCTEYQRRTELVTDCYRLTPENIERLHWMPQSCAYRLLAEGRELPDWHPLVSGNPESVYEAGIAIRDFAILESDLPEDAEWVDYIVGPLDQE